MSVGIYSAHLPSGPDCHYLFSHLSALLWRSAKERNALAKITLARKIIIIINLNTIIATITSIIVIIIAAINTNTIIVIIAIIIITPIASFARKIVDITNIVIINNNTIITINTNVSIATIFRWECDTTNDCKDHYCNQALGYKCK